MSRWSALASSAIGVSAAAWIALASGSDAAQRDRVALDLLVDDLRAVAALDPSDEVAQRRLEWALAGGESAPAELPRGAGGADVYVCALDDDGVMSTAWTGQTGPVNGKHAFSVATTSANAGDTPAQWVVASGKYPVIAQNLYKHIDGRLTQIGMSWVKHGFCAVNDPGCGECTNVPGCVAFLNPGCSDPYSSALNGSQSRLGPRADVNPFTATWTINHFTPQAEAGDPNGVLAGRIQAADEDLRAAMNPGAQYFLEGQYVHPDDVAAGTVYNNASYRRAEVFEGEVMGIDTLFLQPIAGLTGDTQQMQPAIYGWAEVDPDVVVTAVDVPGEGRFHVAHAVRDNGDGTWRYEYAVRNFDSDRAAGVFSAPAPAGVTITNIGFHDVHYHSGDGVGHVNQDPTDWTATRLSDSVEWATEDFATNANANALRWGVMYNFWFDADAAPATQDAVIGLFKPGSPSELVFSISGPSACQADLDGSGDVGPGDLAMLLGDWGQTPEFADFNGDGRVDAVDLATLLGLWGPCG